MQALCASDTKVTEVTIQSAPHEREQESVELQGIAENSAVLKKLRGKDWRVAYKYLRETKIHQLIFSCDKVGGAEFQIEEELNEVQSGMVMQVTEQGKVKYEQLEQENKELKQANSDLMKENEMLKEMLRQNGIALPMKSSE